MENAEPDGIEVIELSPQLPNASRSIDIIWDDDKIEKVSLYRLYCLKHVVPQCSVLSISHYDAMMFDCQFLCL